MKTVRLALLLAIIAASFASAPSTAESYSQYYSTVRDTSGNVVPSATTSVYAAGTITLVPIYSNLSGSPKGNPFLSDAQGGYSFYAAPGLYKIVVTKVGVGTFTFDNVPVGTQPHTERHITGGPDPLDLTAISGELPDKQLTEVRANGGSSSTKAIQDFRSTTTVAPTITPSGATTQIYLAVVPDSISSTHIAPDSVGSSELSDGAVANANVADGAGVVESKLALNFPTHTNSNDPTASEKAALAGTVGTPSGANKYVTNSDSRLADTRVPTSHASTHEDGGADEVAVDVSQVVGEGVGTDLAADLEEEAHSVEHQNGGADEINVTGLSGTLADPQAFTVQKQGIVVGTRPIININEGGNTVLTVVDNPGQNRVDVQIDNLTAVSPSFGTIDVPTGTDVAASTPSETVIFSATAPVSISGSGSTVTFGVSGVDISSDTNLAVTAPVVLTGDTLSVATASTSSQGVVELGTDGEVAALLAVQSNDSRLNNSRTPSGAASGDLSGTYPSPEVSDDSHAHTGSSISSLDISSDTNLAVTSPIVLTGDTLSVSAASTAASGVVEFGTDGEVAALLAVQSNDSRLADSRTPTGSASGDLSGTYPSPAVVNDSHDHTGATLSGVDISSDTNLAVTAPVVLTGDTVSVTQFTFNVKNYGAVGDGSTNDAAAIDSAVAAVIAATTGGVLYFPAGSYIYNGTGVDLVSTVTTKGLRVVGDGPMASYLTFTGCSNTYCLDIRNTNLIGSGQNGSGIQEITVAGVTTENLIRLKNLEAWNISNITTLNGLTALTVEECRLGQASNLYLKGFTAHGVNVIGDSATQSNLYSDVMMISDPAATGNGFNYAITSAGSAGTYLNRVGISLAGTGAAFNIEATTGGTPIYFFCTDCVADGTFPGGAFKMKNVNHVYFENTWSVNHATGSSALELDNVEYGAWIGGHLYALTGNAATGVNLKNGVDNFTLSSTNIHGNDYAISSDGNANSLTLDNVFKTTFDTALVNDFTKISKTAISYSSAFTLLGGTGTSNLLGFKNPSSGTLSYVGQNSSGNLEFLATNGSTVTGRVLNAGGWQSSVMSQVPGIKDADGDTSVEVERTADNDTLHYKTAGTDRIVIDQAGTTTIFHPGNTSTTFTTSTAQLSNTANDGSSYTLTLSKSRVGGSVATNEIVGDISWVFVNSTSAPVGAGLIRALAVDKTAGSEDMDLQLYLVRAGVLTNSIFFRSTGLIEAVTPSKSDVATAVITRAYEDAVTAITVNDNGNGGTAATDTLTPATKNIQYTCNDAQGCDVTLSETGAVNGYRVTIANLSANTVNFADTAGVTELAGAFAMGPLDSMTIIYQNDRWIEACRSNN